MPKPASGESRDDFIDRCVPIVLDDGTAERPDQAVAICNSIWDEESRSMTTNHEKLLKAIRSRTKRRAEFGYGITTADQYVKHAVAECGAGLTCRAFANGENVEALVKQSEQRLAYANPELVCEKQTTNQATFAELLPEGVEVPEKTLMVLQHVVTTPREDRDRDVLVTEGASLDPKAPLLWQHIHTLPLGKVVSTVEHTPDILRVASALIDLNELTSDAAKLVEADVLRFSHGFRALEFEERKADGDDGMFPGFKITKFEIMEISLVSVPSNVDAEIELFSRGKLASDFFKAHAKHYLDARPVTVPGVAVEQFAKTAEVRSIGGTQLHLKIGDAEISVTSPDKSVSIDPQSAPVLEVEEPVEPVEAVEEPQASETPVEEPVETPEPPSETGAACGCSKSEPDEQSEKRGRVISARNLKVLKDVSSDLKELAEMEMPRGGKALCERCIRKLDEVIKSAENTDEDEPRSSEVTAKDAARLVLGSDDAELKKRVFDALSAMFATEALDAKAKRYRELVH